MLIRALTVAVLPFQNRTYSIAAASAFGNSFYAPTYLSSSPASRRRSLSLEKDTSAFANQCSIIPSLSLFRRFDAGLQSIIEFNKIAEDTRCLIEYPMGGKSLQLSRSMRFPDPGITEEGIIGRRRGSMKFLSRVSSEEITRVTKTRIRLPSVSRFFSHVAFDVFMYHLSVSVRLAPF